MNLVGNTTPKFKVLCLHGIGTDSEVFEAQTAALRYHMGENYEYDFIDGPYPWPAAPGIEEVFGDKRIFCSYFDGSEESVIKTIRDLDQHVADNGPYHVIMGFSLGAALAATLLLRDEQQHAETGQPPPKFACAVFLCGTLPCDWRALPTGKTQPQLLHANDVRYPIGIPTVHAWSREDTHHPHQSSQLVQMCDSSTRVEVLHNAGHSVPFQGNELLIIARAVEKALAGLAV